MATDAIMLALLALRLVGETGAAALKLGMIKAGVTHEDLDNLQAERKEVVQEVHDTP